MSSLMIPILIGLYRGHKKLKTENSRYLVRQRTSEGANYVYRSVWEHSVLAVCLRTPSKAVPSAICNQNSRLIRESEAIGGDSIRGWSSCGRRFDRPLLDLQRCPFYRVPFDLANGLGSRWLRVLRVNLCQSIIKCIGRWGLGLESTRLRCSPIISPW